MVNTEQKFAEIMAMVRALMKWHLINERNAQGRGAWRDYKINAVIDEQIDLLEEQDERWGLVAFEADDKKVMFTKTTMVSLGIKLRGGNTTGSGTGGDIMIADRQTYEST